MRAAYEKILPNENSSWAFEHRELQDSIPFEWHYHPEYELTLTLNSRGHRYVGHDVDNYDDGDLVFLGPCLPHTWSSTEKIRPAEPHTALVIKFTERWASGIIELFPEFSRLQQLFAAAECGLCFGDNTRNAARNVICQMPEASASNRLILLMQALEILNQSDDARVMANAPGESRSNTTGDPRIFRTLDYLHQNFTSSISANYLADLACVSVSAFNRMFRKHTRMTLMEYIIRLRLGLASFELIQTERPIAAIAVASGYTNLSLFNRQFAQHKGETPSQFRKRHRAQFL